MYADKLNDHGPDTTRVGNELKIVVRATFAIEVVCTYDDRLDNHNEPMAFFVINMARRICRANSRGQYESVHRVDDECLDDLYRSACRFEQF